MRAPIPQRIPPLVWRKPAFLWTPIALACAVGWPAAVFYNEPHMQRLAMGAGALVFALALATLGIGWAQGRAPKARRIVVAHIVVAAIIVAVLAPLVLARGDMIANVMAMAPLALVMILPAAFISALIFAWLALTPAAESEDADDIKHRVQPFR